MSLLVYLIVGGICGWLASIIMKRDAQQGIILNVVVGIVGAVLVVAVVVGPRRVGVGVGVVAPNVSRTGAAGSPRWASA